MNFTEIAQEILGMTKRPDKLPNIRRAINAAVLFFDTEHDYKRDVQEMQFSLPVPGYEAIIPLNTFTRFRKMSYMKVGGTRCYVEELQSLQLTKDCSILNKWYISGDSIKVKLGLHANTLDLAYYQYPPVLTDANPNFWMLEGNWIAVLNKAAAEVYNDIGDSQSSAGALKDAVSNGVIFKNDYIRGNQHG